MKNYQGSREAQPNLTMAHVNAKKAMDCNEIRGLARCGHSIAKKSTNDFACFNFTFFAMIIAANCHYHCQLFHSFSSSFFWVFSKFQF
jgi:hypothetical protein